MKNLCEFWLVGCPPLLASGFYITFTYVLSRFVAKMIILAKFGEKLVKNDQILLILAPHEKFMLILVGWVSPSASIRI